MRLRSPIWYYGGKGIMVAKILSIIQNIPHHIYCEPFGGGASVLLAKQPSKVEVYNDIDSDLVNLFRVLRNEEKFKEFHRLISLTPYSREEYCYAVSKLMEENLSDVERAYYFFVKMRQSFSGRGGSGWSFSIKSSNRGMAGGCNNWLSAIEILPEISARLMRVQIENNDFRKVFETYDTKETLFYVDPPYIHETRTEKTVYKHELTNEEHKDLVDILLNLKGYAVLSGYKHEIYEKLEKHGWNRIDYKTACIAAGKTRYTKIQGKGSAFKMVPRTESVWISNKVPSLLNLFGRI